jgi:hypothetical protein
MVTAADVEISDMLDRGPFKFRVYKIENTNFLKKLTTMIESQSHTSDIAGLT